MIEFNEEEVEKYRVGLGPRLFAWVSRLFGWALVSIYFRVINRMIVIGKENLPPGGGVLICANHQSWADTLLLPLASAEFLKTSPYMAPAKEELFKNKMVATIISWWGAFPVKRRQRDLESMRKIAFYVKNYRVMLFPEGTRSKTGELLKGRSGVGWIIQTSQPIVVPAILINTEIYPGSKRGSKLFNIPYTVVFGEPVDLSELYAAEDDRRKSQTIADKVMEEIAKLRLKHLDLHINRPELTEKSDE